MRWGLAAAGLLALAACKDEKAAAPKPAEPLAERGLRAVEQDLWAAAAHPERTRFRGVAAWVQAQPQRVAVCGQVNAFADDPNIYVPFVSVVTFGGRDQFEHIVGTSTAEAGRVYAAAVALCYDGGGPAVTAPRSAPPTPPLPEAVPNPAVPAPLPPVPQAARAGEVTVRQSANLHADPHGATVRTVPRGASLHVFAQAAGGWLQVGDSAPWGWVHESMVERH